MRHLIAVASLVLATSVYAATAQLSNTEVTRGLKEALVQGADKAVAQLGQVNGFLENPKVKIPLPEHLQRAEKTLRFLGMGKQADELVLRMNRAAEAAVPHARELLINSVKQMSITDAKTILTGSEDAATQYFRKTTSVPLSQKFLPIVQDAMKDVSLAQQYNEVAKLGQRYGLVKKEQSTLEDYITQKTLDGVYLMMAEEEKKIRKDPVKAGSEWVKKVFGAIKK
jgi:hypothetical protein